MSPLRTTHQQATSKKDKKMNSICCILNSKYVIMNSTQKMKALNESQITGVKNAKL